MVLTVNNNLVINSTLLDTPSGVGQAREVVVRNYPLLLTDGTGPDQADLQHTDTIVLNTLSQSIATRVGSASAFGVGETAPTGLTVLNGTLYMVGNATDALYTVDPATGIATRVGSASAFGVGETTPGAIAALDGTLYMVGRTNRVLYTLNATTGVATRVGNANAFGVDEIDPRGLAALDGILYMVGANDDSLLTVNTTTGVATRVNSSLFLFGVNEGVPAGLAALNGTLYMVGAGSDALFTVDPATGVATRVSGVVSFGVDESIPSGLAVLDDTLYMVGVANSTLYTLGVEGVAINLGTAPNAFGTALGARELVQVFVAASPDNTASIDVSGVGVPAATLHPGATLNAFNASADGLAAVTDENNSITFSSDDNRQQQVDIYVIARSAA